MLVENIRIRPNYKGKMPGILAYVSCNIGLFELTGLVLRRNAKGHFIDWPHSHLGKKRTKVHFVHPIDKKIAKEIEKEIVREFNQRIDKAEFKLERKINKARRVYNGKKHAKQGCLPMELRK